MENQHQHHENVIKAFREEWQAIFDSSEQAIYAYLDDEHKICNQKFATLLGYASPEEWAKMDGSFPQLFVSDESQNTLVNSYSQAMEKMVGSTNTVKWKKKSGETVDSTVMLVPLPFQGHLLALHFINA